MSEIKISRSPTGQRRIVLGAGPGVGPWLSAMAKDAMPQRQPDRFVHLTGPRKGQRAGYIQNSETMSEVSVPLITNVTGKQ
jgi:hypothetical protein